MPVLAVRPIALSAVLSAVTVAPGLLDQHTVDTDGLAWVLLTAWGSASFVIGISVLVRPAWAVVGTFVVLGVVELFASALQVELTFLDLLPTVAALFVTGAIEVSRAVLASAAFVIVATLLGMVVNQFTAEPEWQGDIDVLAGLLVLLLGLVAGLAVSTERHAARTARELLQQEQQAREIAELTAAQRERTRIAREMHDLVAHSVTLLVLNAETLRARRAELPTWAAEQADMMADAGRRATGEMRELLVVLSDPDSAGLPSTIAPASGVRFLVDEARSAGLKVKADLVDDSVFAAQGPVVYRIVQEALSNARRHSPDWEVQVRLRVEGNEVDLLVEGCGDPHRGSRPGGSGLGVGGVAGRVIDAGGTIEITSHARLHRMAVRLPLAIP